MFRRARHVAEQAAPGVRPEPDDARQPAVEIAKPDGADERGEIAAQRAHGLLVARVDRDDQKDRRPRQRRGDRLGNERSAASASQQSSLLLRRVRTSRKNRLRCRPAARCRSGRGRGWAGPRRAIQRAGGRRCPRSRITAGRRRCRSRRRNRCGWKRWIRRPRAKSTTIEVRRLQRVALLPGTGPGLTRTMRKRPSALVATRPKPRKCGSTGLSS